MMHWRPFYLTVILAFCTCALAATASAQRHKPVPPISGGGQPAPRRDIPNPPSPFGSPHEEMLERAAIKYDEREHKEALERAKEGARLGDELRADFERTKSLTPDALKKLERIEKTARHIRKRAGGSDSDDVLNDPPNNLETALPRLAEVAEELNKSVAKTSRHVVSTNVIDRSNELIELIRLVRTFIQK